MPLGSVGQKTRITTQIAVTDLGAATDDLIKFVGPAKVYRIGAHLTDEAKTTGTAWVISVQSVVGVTETVLGTATSPDTVAVGATVYKEFNPPLVVPAGAFGKLEVTTAGNTGQGEVWAEISDEPLTKTYLDGLVAMT